MTLDELQIDDVEGLLDIEKRAKIDHLATSRSGVFHVASNGGYDEKNILPRGSKEPGSYYVYNNWDFNNDLINQYLGVLESINIDCCEIGFRFYKNKGFKGSCAFSTEEFLSSLEIPKNLKIAIMINAGELIEDDELIIDRLKKLIPLKSCDSRVDMVRVACHSEVIEKILPVFDYLNSYINILVFLYI